MCIAVSGRIISIDETKEYATALVRGNKIEVNIKLIDAQINDFILIHAGYAMEIVKEDTANEIDSLLQELEEI